MTPIAKLSEVFAVAPQLQAEDFVRAAEAGFTLVINNRPDAEEFGQLSHAQAEAAAREAGLAYLHIPVRMPLPADAVEATERAMAATQGPILAYCRTGTRSAALWALAAARRGAPPEDILSAAAKAGYDLSGLPDLLGTRA